MSLSGLIYHFFAKLGHFGKPAKFCGGSGNGNTEIGATSSHFSGTPRNQPSYAKKWLAGGRHQGTRPTPDTCGRHDPFHDRDGVDDSTTPAASRSPKNPPKVEKSPVNNPKLGPKRCFPNSRRANMNVGVSYELTRAVQNQPYLAENHPHILMKHPFSSIASTRVVNWLSAISHRTYTHSTDTRDKSGLSTVASARSLRPSA